MSVLLTKEALLAAAKKPLPMERVELPELGGAVFVRAMGGKERDAWEMSLLSGKGKRQRMDYNNVRAKLAVRCLCDESGTRLLGDEDADALGGLHVTTLNKIYEAAQRLCGVRDEDVEELGKSSAPADGNDSPTS